MTARPLNVLLLCNRTGRSVDARTVTDHLDAFGRYSRHRIQELSFLRELPAALDLAQFDVLAIHYTIAIGWLSDHYFSPASRQKVREFGGLKVLFIQDEYRAVRQLHETLRFMKMDLLFTCVPEGEIEKVYPAAALPGLAKVNNLTGYVPQSLLGMKVERTAQDVRTDHRNNADNDDHSDQFDQRESRRPHPAAPAPWHGEHHQ